LHSHNLYARILDSPEGPLSLLVLHIYNNIFWSHRGVNCDRFLSTCEQQHIESTPTILSTDRTEILANRG
jgi:hypothetical protein